MLFFKWNSFYAFLPFGYYYIKLYSKQCRRERKTLAYSVIKPVLIIWSYIFIKILFCVQMSTLSFNNASGTFLDLKKKIKQSLSLYIIKRFFIICELKFLNYISSVLQLIMCTNVPLRIHFVLLSYTVLSIFIVAPCILIHVEFTHKQMHFY